MNIHRWSVAGLLTITLLTPGLAACDPIGGKTASSSGSTAPAVPDDPKQALLASTEEITKGNFRYLMRTDGGTVEGVVHLPSRSARLTVKSADSTNSTSMNMDIIHIDPESWVKLDVKGMDAVPGVDKLKSDKYLHLDQSKIEGLDGLRFDFSNVDPAGSPLLTESIVNVQKTGEGAYSGTIDLTKASNAALADDDALKALGVKAQSLPFEAKVDPQGRLTDLTIQVPAVGENKAHDLQITYSDYGAATPPEKPAPAETEEAPDALYEFFG